MAKNKAKKHKFTVELPAVDGLNAKKAKEWLVNTVTTFDDVSVPPGLLISQIKVRTVLEKKTAKV